MRIVLEYARGLLMVLVCLWVVSESYGQEYTGPEAEKRVPGASRVYYWQLSDVPRYIDFQEAKDLNSLNLRAYLNKTLALSNDYDYQPASQTDQLEIFHVYFRNHRVDGSQVRLHKSAGKVQAISLSVFDNMLATSSRLDSASALLAAMKDRPSQNWAWEDTASESNLKNLFRDPTMSLQPKLEQRWFPKKIDHPEGAWVLCWVVQLYSFEPLFHQKVYLDASSGEVVFREDLIHETNAFGTAETKYSGTRTIRTDSMSNGIFRLRDSSLSAKLETYDMNNGTSYNNAVDFIDSNNYWNNVNADQDEVATDAHWGAEMTLHYFQDHFGRNSFDGNGAAIRSFVHYRSNYNNAFWNGYFMTYGDGNGSTFTPLTCIDVCGHEIAHAVTTYTANLIYRNESGALNESFSDIFGNSIEFDNKSNASWKIGEEMTPNGTGIRNMQNPKIKGDPKTHLGQYWYSGTGDNGGVHINSGVQNYWYYLLCEGGSGTNDNNDAFTVDSIGQEKAQQVAYRNLSTYLSRFSDYQDARYFAILSANDLYGPCSDEVRQVTNAWYACGVGDEFDSTVTEAYFQSEDFFCFAPATVSFQNLSTNAVSFHWDFGDGTTDTAVNPVHTYSVYGNFDVTLVAFNCFGNGTDTLIQGSQVNIDSTPDICHALIMPFNANSKQEFCEGFIYDDGGEEPYSGLHESILTIETPFADSISFAFHEFAYENNYDYLYLYRGADTSSPLIGRYSGNNRPFNGDTVMITGNAITIQHTSDPAVVGSGFKIRYNSYREAVSVQAPADDMVCPGDSLEVSALWTAPDSNSLVFYWIDSLSGERIAYGPHTRIQPDSSSTFGVVLLDACNLQTDTSWFHIEVLPKLALSLVSDTTVCRGEDFQLSLQGKGGRVATHQYTWLELGLTGQPTIRFDRDTTLHVVLSDNCSAHPDTGIVEVRVRPDLSLALFGDSIHCPGSTTIFTTLAGGGDSTNYQFSWNEQAGTDTFSLAQDFTGNIKVELQDQCTAGSKSDSLWVRSIPTMTYSRTPDSLICYRQEIPIAVSIQQADFGTLEIFWDNSVFAGDSMIMSDPGSGTSYNFELRDQCQSVFDSVTLTMRPKLQFITERDTVICYEESLRKDLEAVGGLPGHYEYFWSDGFVGESRNWTPSVTYQYQVRLSDGCSPDDSGTFTVQLRDPLFLDLGEDKAICNGQPVYLAATGYGGFGSNYSYFWNGNPGANIEQFSPSITTDYVVEFRDGCSSPVFDTIRVKVTKPVLPQISLSSSIICVGMDVLVEADDSAYLMDWRFSNGKSSRDRAWMTENWQTPGIYDLSLTLTDDIGCKHDTSILAAVEVVNKAYANFELSAHKLLLEEAILNARALDKQAEFYDWNLQGDHYSSPVFSHLFADTGTFKVSLRVEDRAGCADTSVQTVWVYEPGRVWLPNSFTPNDDQYNSTYSPVFMNMASGELSIFNRWGEEVYHCDDLNACEWDGNKSDGSPALDGYYLVIFKGMTGEGLKIEERLTLYLVR